MMKKISKHGRMYADSLYFKARSVCMKDDIEDTLRLLTMAFAFDDKLKKDAVDDSAFEKLHGNKTFLNY